jgi:hypothetical protein
LFQPLAIFPIVLKICLPCALDRSFLSFLNVFLRAENSSDAMLRYCCLDLALFFAKIRSVRAPCFRDKTFENQLGKSNYKWMKSLGNAGIKENRIRIWKPEAIHDLLDFALMMKKMQRRIVFFCACDIHFQKNLNTASIQNL